MPDVTEIISRKAEDSLMKIHFRLRELKFINMSNGLNEWKYSKRNLSRNRP
jgi:hypothetical protein